MTVSEEARAELVERGGGGWLRAFTLPNVLTAIYLVVGGVMVAGHALWRDEAQAFLIARDSSSIREVIYNLRFEGHPPLWHLLLWVLTRVTRRPEAMQWLHLAMAATTVWVVARYAPFPKIAKVLFAFGYYPLFEYGVISRNYQLFLLLSVVFCAVWERNRRAYVRLGVILGLMAMSHVCGTILAAGLGVMLVADAMTVRRGIWSWRFVVGFCIAVAGAAAAVQVMRPKPGGTYAEGWNWDMQRDHVQHTMRAMCEAWVPVSPWDQKFWNQSVVQDDAVAAEVGYGCTVVGLLMVASSWRALLFLVVSDAGLLLFFHAKFYGDYRQHGALFVALVAALWIAWSARPRAATEWRWWRKELSWVPRVAFTALLGLHVYGAVIPMVECWKYPFSPGRAAAAVIRANLKPGDVVVSESQVLSTSVAAYLPGVKMYFPEQERWGTFTLWTSIPQGDADAEIFRAAMAEHRGRIVLRCWDIGRLPRAEVLGTFGEGIADDEAYSVQRIEALGKK